MATDDYAAMLGEANQALTHGTFFQRSDYGFTCTNGFLLQPFRSHTLESACGRTYTPLGEPQLGSSGSTSLPLWKHHVSTTGPYYQMMRFLTFPTPRAASKPSAMLEPLMRGLQPFTTTAP